MTDKEILQKAIEIAIDNGYDWSEDSLLDPKYEVREGRIHGKITSCIVLANDIIFSHDFAKAFWKDEQLFGHIALPKGSATATRLSHSWEYNLQQMVLEENPIDYLRKFIENKD